MSINIRWKTADGKLIKINALENGGFETGDLTGYTSSGAVIYGLPYAGSYCVGPVNALTDWSCYQDISIDSDLVAEVYCYSKNNITGDILRITYDDATVDSVQLNTSGTWTKVSITPDANKVITRVSIICGYGTAYSRVDNITVTCQNRVPFTAADGKLTQDADFPTTVALNVFINASDKLYQADKENY